MIIIINDNDMKPLDKNKKYDLSQLNDEQFQAVLDWLKENDTGWENTFITDVEEEKTLYFEGNEWLFDLELLKGSVNALELFEEEPNCCEITVNNMGRVEPKYPNYSFDKSDIYQRADQLMQDGKQHGLKIVVTFEKL